MNIDWYCISRG